MKYFILLSKKIYLGIFISIISIFIIDTYSENIPLFISWGQTFENVYNKLCLAFLSSSVFYFLIVHIRQVDTDITMNNIAYKHLDYALYEHDSLITYIKKELNINKDDSLSEADITELNSKLVNTNEPAPFNIFDEQANWYEFFDFKLARVKFHLDQLTPILPLLSSDLVSFVHLAHKSVTLYKFEFYSSNHAESDPLIVLGNFNSDFKDYLTYIENLKKYKNKMKYIE